MTCSIRHSISLGGRFFPPPKYCSNSILSWRISRSRRIKSSSVWLVGLGRGEVFMLKESRKHVNWTLGSLLPIRYGGGRPFYIALRAEPMLKCHAMSSAADAARNHRAERLRKIPAVDELL